MKIEEIQGEFYHNTRKMAEEIIRLREFIESITDASGPYQDLNGHNIVQDAYKALKGE